MEATAVWLYGNGSYGAPILYFAYKSDPWGAWAVKHPQSGPDLKMRQKMAMGGTPAWDGPGIFRSGPLCGCFMDDGVFDIYF
jgi:hypothetical protein